MDAEALLLLISFGLEGVEGGKGMEGAGDALTECCECWIGLDKVIDERITLHYIGTSRSIDRAGKQ